MRASMAFFAIAVLAATLPVLPAGGQEERRVSIVPERPLAGSAFVVQVILPGEPAEAVVPLEPVLRGSARYTGADVRPGLDGEGLDSAIVEYHFMAGDAGTIDIIDLSVRSGKRLLQFGSWSIDVVSGSQEPVRRYGTWSAPDSVLVRELFAITALDPEGNPVACPSFAVEGSLFEPVSGQPGRFRAVALEPGILRLPRLELGVDAGRFELRPFSLAVKDLPASARDVDAVGGPWRLELVAPESGTTVTEGEVVAWELRASGSGCPGLAASPELTVEAPDGSDVPAGAGLSNSGSTGTPGGSFASLRGAFKVQAPGIYTVRPLPYAWLELSTRTVRLAVAPAVRIMVVAAAAPAWTAPETVVVLAVARLTALAARDAAWAYAADSASRGDWATARSEAYLATGLTDERGALSAANLRGKGAVEKAFAVAAATLIAVSPTTSSAEAFAVFLRLERRAFPARGAKAMADAAAASFGNLDRVSYVLPPFGLFFVAGLACVTAVAVLAVRGVLQRRSARPQGRTTRTAAVIMAVLCVAAFGLGLASVLERTNPRFVSLGGTARAVPSDLAAEGESVDAGRTGRVLESTAQWLFVVLDDGGAVWLSAHDAARY